MFYKKYLPQESLRNYVECFYIWEGCPQQPILIESPPSALCAIVFNYKEPYRVTNLKYKSQKVPVNFVCGQEISNYTLHIHGEIGLIGIVMRPTTLYQILGLSMYAFTNERIALEEVLDVHSLIQFVVRTRGQGEKISALEAFVIDKLEKSSYGTPEITIAANDIFEKKGMCKIPELIASSFMSRRTFERKFLEEVGVSPKLYARIRRFGYTCSLMAGNRDADMMKALHRGGYYDQSHFIKDFKYFSGRTPGQYLKNNEELANYVQPIPLVERKIVLQGNLDEIAD